MAEKGESRMDASLIERALDIAGERHGDLTARVYARLFAAHPEMEALFVRDTNGSVRGEMLARVFEMVLDFIDRRTYAAQMIQCEVITHDGYGVPPEVFGLFFGVVADTLREVVGDDWTAEMDASWTEMLADMVWFARHPTQTLTTPSSAAQGSAGQSSAGQGHAVQA
jgi:hemoglobin-like flavoprotein